MTTSSLRLEKMPIDSNSPLVAVLAFAGWTMLHMVIMITHRSILINSGKAATNAFPPSRDEKMETFYGRVCAAHANCIENLVLFSAIVLPLNTLLNGGNVIDLSTLAWRVVYLRVGQSVSHWYSVSEMAVTVRFMFFAVQLSSMGTMLYRAAMLE